MFTCMAFVKVAHMPKVTKIRKGSVFLTITAKQPLELWDTKLTDTKLVGAMNYKQ